MRSLSKLQWFIILTAVVLVVGLYNLDLVAPNTSKGGKAEAETTNAQASLNFEELKSDALKSVPADVKNNITVLEKKLKEASAENEKSHRLELADAYFAYKQFAVAGYYYLEQSEKEGNNADLFVKAGDAFRNAYRNSGDSSMVPLFMEKAKSSYERALKLAPESLDAKTGVATCYVEGSDNPMQGITMLREVVQVEPENVNANLNLGLFSMRSGQFDKAIGRLETVVKKKPSAENYALLAEAFEQNGQKDKAIQALTKAKEYVIDPQIIMGIDDYIKTLKK